MGEGPPCKPPLAPPRRTRHTRPARSRRESAAARVAGGPTGVRACQALALPRSARDPAPVRPRRETAARERGPVSPPPPAGRLPRPGPRAGTPTGWKRPAHRGPGSGPGRQANGPAGWARPATPARPAIRRVGFHPTAPRPASRRADPGPTAASPAPSGPPPSARPCGCRPCVREAEPSAP